MFYLNFMDLRVAGSSPEMLLRCEKNVLIPGRLPERAPEAKIAEEKRLEKSLLKDLKNARYI
jgi:anthranilate/para-aminobenzoate synthase component I